MNGDLELDDLNVEEEIPESEKELEMVS